jgi:hypothetical protein
MLSLALALAAALIPPTDVAPIPLTDAEFCDGAQVAVESLRATYPRQVDAITRMETASIDCPARTMELGGSVILNMTEMRQGWITERQAAWDAQTCKGAMLTAARLGWHFRQTYRFKDGAISSIDAACL